MRGLPHSLIISAAELSQERGFSALNVPLSKHNCHLIVTDSVAALLLCASPDNWDINDTALNHMRDIEIARRHINITGDQGWLRWLRQNKYGRKLVEEDESLAGRVIENDSSSKKAIKFVKPKSFSGALKPWIMEILVNTWQKHELRVKKGTTSLVMFAGY